MVARFQPISAGAECRTEKENKFCRGMTGAGKASSVNGEEKVCNGGVVEEKVCTSDAAEAESLHRWPKRRVH
jgi:hypothetical protein